MLLPNLSCVFISCINLVTPRVCWPKNHFWPEMKTEMGVVIYMQPQISLTPNIYGFMGLIPKVQVFLLK